MSYYDLSSSDKSDEDAESCSEDDHDDDNDEVNDEQDHNQYRHTVVVTRIPSDKQHLWTRSIVHVDVDCFYCQCEQVDGPPDFRERPVAIGQKHIIVTCNYLARDLGVKKLQSKQDALRACPSLLILEGSDLERYRRHSRHIYLAFREELQLMGRDHGVSVPVRKGGMDEAFGDMTNLVTATLERNQRTLPPVSTCAAHVYGNDSNETSVLTEDQTGAQTIVHGQQHASALDNAHVHYGSDRERRECQQRLECAAAIAERVRRLIYNKVGFVTTMGISVSPMLAKLASDLKVGSALQPSLYYSCAKRCAFIHLSASSSLTYIFSETKLPQHTLSMAIGKPDTSHATTENSRAGIWYIEGAEDVFGTRS
jgi:DNA polymerase iota